MKSRYAPIIASLLASLPLTALADVTGFTGGSTPQPTIQPSTAITYMIHAIGNSDDIGEVGMFAGNFIPDGWLPCDGSIMSINNQNSQLFSAISTIYGGDGQTTFQLPNLLGRTVIGTGQGTGLTNRSLGDSVGSDTVQLTVANLPPDAHSLPTGGTTGITGAGTPYSNMQASLALNFLVPLAGIFPSHNAVPGAASPLIAGGQPLLGTIHISASPAVPSGYALANGQTFVPIQNAALFSLLGTNYGGNGQTTFALPDLRGRAAIGAGSAGPGRTNQVLGEDQGTEALTLSVSQLPPHTHTLPGGGTTASEGSGQSQSNLQPTLALHYIIAEQGLFPTHDGSGGVESSDAEPILGQIELFAGIFAPTGWAFCDGQLLAINQNQALFFLLANTYGGNGQTTFALPNLDASLTVDAGQGAGLMPWSLGQTTGAENNTLTLDQMPDHDHTLPTPEPASLTLLAASSLLLLRRRKNR